MWPWKGKSNAQKFSFLWRKSGCCPAATCCSSFQPAQSYWLRTKPLFSTNSEWPWEWLWRLMEWPVWKYHLSTQQHFSLLSTCPNMRAQQPDFLRVGMIQVSQIWRLRRQGFLAVRKKGKGWERDESKDRLECKFNVLRIKKNFI